MGIEDARANVQNNLACKCITPMGIKVVSEIVQNIRACKYITSMGIEIVLMVVKSGDKSPRTYIK